MNVDEVRQRVEYIRSIAGDDEMAHGEEDKLRGDVLRAIADGADSPALLAGEALRTGEIYFSRWYA